MPDFIPSARHIEEVERQERAVPRMKVLLRKVLEGPVTDELRAEIARELEVEQPMA